MKRGPKRLFLISAGYLALAFGTIGIFVPVLPTTPFVILAATCFSVSSPSLQRKIENSKLLGPYLAHWRTREGVSIPIKRRAIIMLWSSMALSALIVRNLIVILFLVIVGSIVTAHIVLIKTKRELPRTTNQEKLET
ncbi:MAG: YbaN family protein [Sphaerochaetaceae bacterium]|nr:YbaN family protein [Sphaerochaetaceae bacterium]